MIIRDVGWRFYLLQIKRSTAWNRAFEELKHHQNLLQKLTTHDVTCDSDNNDGPKPAKIRNVKSARSKVALSNGVSPVKQIIKDLRVKVERLTTDGNSETQLNQVKMEKTMVDNESSRSASEDRQVPHLPVAMDEPAHEIFSSCPQELKKEGSQEDMVTSSSQEPRSKCVLVQTDQIQSDSVPAKAIIYHNLFIKLFWLLLIYIFLFFLFQLIFYAAFYYSSLLLL